MKVNNDNAFFKANIATKLLYNIVLIIKNSQIFKNK